MGHDTVKNVTTTSPLDVITAVCARDAFCEWYVNGIQAPLSAPLAYFAWLKCMSILKCCFVSSCIKYFRQYKKVFIGLFHKEIHCCTSSIFYALPMVIYL